MAKLNLGAGDCPLDGYENLDRKTGQEVYPLPQYPDNSIDEVRASHVLEHFGRGDVYYVLQEWVRVLKPGGWLKIAVPDFDRVARYHLEHPEDEEYDAEGYILGGQTDSNDFHHSLYNEDRLRSVFEALGLTDIQRWESDAQDCSALEVSLNLMGRKPEAGTQPTAAPATEEPPYAWLATHLRNVYSQGGEDGILEAILKRVGETNRTIIECGAGDPVICSNSRYPIERGWQAVLIEPDPERFQRLNAEYWQKASVTLSPVRVGVGEGETDLDTLFDSLNVPQEPDLMVLDVDGQEFHLWNALLRYRPRVVVVEYDAGVDPRFIPPRGGEGQAGYAALEELGNVKGYEVVARGPYNIFFVARPLHELVMGKQPRVVEGPVLPGETPALTEAPSVSEVLVDLDDMGRKVMGVMTRPRLTFSINAECIHRGLAPLGIRLHSVEGVFWPECLTRGIQHVLKEGFEYILTLDYDTGFSAEDVAHLFHIMEQHPEVDALCPVQINRGFNGPLFTVGTDKQIHLDSLPSHQPLMRIRSGHFGLTMLRAKAFERMEKPWFLAVPDKNGDWGEGRTEADVAFWLKWNKCGNSLYLANRVTVGHMELLMAWPDHRLRTQYQLVKDFIAHGKPKGAWR